MRRDRESRLHAGIARIHPLAGQAVIPNCTAVIGPPLQTRSQAIARIADRAAATASQHFSGHVTSSVT